MTQPTQDFREEEIKIDRTFYQLFGGAVLVLIGIGIGALLFSGDGGYTTNLYTEGISVALTIFVLNTLAERREDRRRVEELKARLVREAGSSVNAVAVKAIEEIRAHGWLEGNNGILRGSILSKANLCGANLEDANLCDVVLNDANLSASNMNYANLAGADLSNSDLSHVEAWQADMSKTDFWQANLSNADLEHVCFVMADLSKANISGANLWQANLKDVRLRGANLSGVYLAEANLTGADLRQVKLKNANLHNAIFDETTLLPDGSNWTIEKQYAKWWERYGAVWLDFMEWDDYREEHGLS
jgi:uncharacterized protein YjbI with pentapeptide repeats